MARILACRKDDAFLKPRGCGADQSAMASERPGAQAAASTDDVRAIAPSKQEAGIDGLAALANQPTVENAVAAVREFLGMEMAFTSEFDDEHQVLRVLCGDAESFYASEGLALPLEHTYCRRVLDGRLPNLIPDTRADERAAELPGTTMAGIGAYVSMPLRFSDGRLYGTLCAANHEAKNDLGYRELQFLQVFARLISDILEREALQRADFDARIKAASTETLIAAVEARDHYTGEHSAAVVSHAVAVARELGLSGDAVADVEQVALLHDIGKIAIPDAILHKPGRLDEREWEIMRTHPVAGAELVANAPGLAHLARAIRGEHERWDGRGYPDGLAGETIPIASRITFVCDAYHAMTSDRPYRRAMREEDARSEIEAGSGTQFSPTVAAAFLKILRADLVPGAPAASANGAVEIVAALSPFA
jgi:HD-GYP domain-containing protein (c-di-GMP phosphodiesterase class II)